jgi:hypothetical protein
MEKNIKDYIAWYKTERNTFCREIYIDKSTWLKKKLLPYSNWDDESVLVEESNFALAALTKLKNKNINKNTISLAQLTLSNRVEYISDQSDFYVTYAGLMIFTLAIIGMALPFALKAIISILILVGVLYSLNQRLKLRQEVAMSKELINIFKQYESKHA